MKKLLYISHRVPFPPDKGERLRAYHQLRVLTQHYDVTLATLRHGHNDATDLGPLTNWCRHVIVQSAAKRSGIVRHPLKVLHGCSMTELWFSSNAMRRSLSRLCREQSFDIVMGYCSSVLPYVLEVPAPVRVLDLVDVDSAKWNGYTRTSRLPMRWLYRREAIAVARLEQQALQQCQAVLVTSSAEARLVDHSATNVHVVGNGVDSDYFSPGVPVDDSHPAIVFTGTMDYRPNAEAVCWFAREVWPSLRRAVPNLEWRIVGRDPLPEVQGLAKLAGVVVTGSVPDVRPLLRTASVAIVPLQTARGIQNKILEAMACGRPVVASSVALQGIGAEIGSELLQADAPAQWIDSIVGLLKDKTRREEVGAAGRTRVVRQYAWEPQLAGMLEVLASVTRTQAGRSATPVRVSGNASTVCIAGEGRPV